MAALGASLPSSRVSVAHLCPRVRDSLADIDNGRNEAVSSPSAGIGVMIFARRHRTLCAGALSRAKPRR
jgi:hypothetical protein